MANRDAPRGFTPVSNYRCRSYYKDASAGILGVGDPVIRVTNSSDPKGRPEVVRATTGAAITGVIVGIDPNWADLGQRHLAAADLGYVLVCDDPEALFVVQEVTGGTALAVTNIGEHIDAITAVDADTVTGRSKYEIDNAALATNNTFRLEALLEAPDNVVGEHAKWIVSANLHTEANASASRKTEV